MNRAYRSRHPHHQILYLRESSQCQKDYYTNSGSVPLTNCQCCKGDDKLRTERRCIMSGESKIDNSNSFRACSEISRVLILFLFFSFLSWGWMGCFCSSGSIHLSLPLKSAKVDKRLTESLFRCLFTSSTLQRSTDFSFTAYFASLAHSPLSRVLKVPGDTSDSNGGWHDVLSHHHHQ